MAEGDWYTLDPARAIPALAGTQNAPANSGRSVRIATWHAVTEHIAVHTIPVYTLKLRPPRWRIFDPSPLRGRGAVSSLRAQVRYPEAGRHRARRDEPLLNARPAAPLTEHRCSVRSASMFNWVGTNGQSGVHRCTTDCPVSARV